MYAPLVYVDYEPQDPSKEYQARGMTLVTITAPSSGPIAAREGDLIIPGTQIAYGGFATLLGFTSTAGPASSSDTRDVYLLGAASNGLQMARVGLDDVESYTRYSYFNPQSLEFSETSPDPNTSDYTQIYLPGTFTSGSVFYSMFPKHKLTLKSIADKRRPLFLHLLDDLFQQNGRLHVLHSFPRSQPATR